jgi:hypothetical protein
VQGEALGKDAGGWHPKGREICAEHPHHNRRSAQKYVPLDGVDHDTLEKVAGHETTGNRHSGKRARSGKRRKAFLAEDVMNRHAIAG